jgi:hypothetical protein
MRLFTLNRVSIGPHGCFGVLIVGEVPIAVTLEPVKRPLPNELFTVIPPGYYVCKRDMFNRGGYWSYEIPLAGHSELKFHCGNRMADSEGCILVASAFKNVPGVSPAISASVDGYATFMLWCAGEPEIALNIVQLWSQPTRTATRTN